MWAIFYTHSALLGLVTDNEQQKVDYWSTRDIAEIAAWQSRYVDFCMN